MLMDHDPHHPKCLSPSHLHQLLSLFLHNCALHWLSLNISSPLMQHLWAGLTYFTHWEVKPIPTSQCGVLLHRVLQSQNMNSMNTCPSVTFYFMKISFSDIDRKWILPNMIRAGQYQKMRFSWNRMWRKDKFSCNSCLSFCCSITT